MQVPRLKTNSPIDKLLGGGLEIGAITNFYGEAGSGKTNLALIATKAAIDAGKKVVYIDTENNFSFERFAQIVGKGRVEDYLENVFLIEPKSWKEQCEQIEKLRFLVKNEDIGLIVVDSIVSLYRLELTDENHVEVNKEHSRQYATLMQLAREYNLAVLVTNQIYTISGKIELTSRLIAKYWSKALVKLEKLDRANRRRATIIKHRSLPEGKAMEFEITGNGIKEVKLMGLLKI